MYGIIHKEIFDSTVMSEGYEVVYVFVSMITLANEDDVVDMTAHTLASRIGMPLEKVEHALDRLTRPDPSSKSDMFEGRRVIPLHDIKETKSNRGWFVVNREDYIQEAQRKHRRSYMRDLMREKRGKKSANKKGSVSKLLDHIDIDIDININTDLARYRNIIPPPVRLVELYCRQRKNGIDPRAFLDHYETCGWVQGKGRKPIKDWQAAVRTWESTRKKEKDNSDPTEGAI